MRSLGAAEVIDSRAPDVTERLRTACPRGVDLSLDTFAGNDLTGAVELLAWRGRVVLLAGSRTRPVLPAGPLCLKDCTVTGFAISRATTAELAGATAVLNRALADGSLRVRATETLPLEAAAEAHGPESDGLLGVLHPAGFRQKSLGHADRVITRLGDDHAAHHPGPHGHSGHRILRQRLRRPVPDRFPSANTQQPVRIPHSFRR